MEQLPLPAARTTDPHTSHEAAASITSLSARREAVLRVIKTLGTATDVDIAIGYPSIPDAPEQSPSGLRTRRKELVELGLVADTGRRARLKSGRKAIVWTAA